MICLDGRLVIFRYLTTHIVLLMVLTVVPLVSFADWYKYVNEDGVTVLDSSVPARYVKHGYTILNEEGRVIEVIPRALTDEELREREDELAERLRLAREKREQIVADQNLLILYSTPEDVERARDTKLASIEGFIDTQKDHLRRLQGQKRDLEARFADVERVGGTIEEQSLDRIRITEGRMAQIDAEIAGKRSEMDVLRTHYATDLKRVRELLDSDSIYQGTSH